MQDETKDRDAGPSPVPATPSPRRADRDLALLARPELRAVRLGLEYLKPELILNEHGIRHTVVVFASTRLLDPDRAAARLETARAQLAAAPDEPGHRRALRDAERDVANSHYYEVAREFGRIVGRYRPEAPDDRLAIITGGGPGGMEAANRGALEVGGLSVGLNITLPLEQKANAYMSPDLAFEFRYFAVRKLHFMLRARALVALPGGYGTLDELFETLCLVQTHKKEALPVVLVGERYWRALVDFDFLVSEGMIDAEDRDLVMFAETASETWAAIQDWYAKRGRTITGADR